MKHGLAMNDIQTAWDGCSLRVFMGKCGSIFAGSLCMLQSHLFWSVAI
jgi:hypothetical protein